MELKNDDFVLTRVYGIEEGIKVYSNGSWTTEQYTDVNARYQARILPTGEIYIHVTTLDTFPKTVCDFRVLLLETCGYLVLE